jgi:hypothetical protein
MTITLIRRSDALGSASARNGLALATNVLRPFLPTNLLIPLLGRSGSPGPVSSCT